MDATAQFFRAPGQGTRVWVIDEHITFVATGDDTGGAYALTESEIAPGGGPPPHVHHREDEGFWILEGELEVQVGEERHRAAAGSYVHLPRGVLHSFRCVGDRSARFLTLLVPAGLERFFEEVGIPTTDANAPPEPTDDEIQRLITTAARYGVEIP